MKTCIIYLISLLVTSPIAEIRTVETPTLAVNFYMMGKTEVDQEVAILINDNIEYLNEEFEGAVKFRLGGLYLDEKHEYIPDLHKVHLRSRYNSVDDIVGDIEQKGSISIFLFETYVEEGQEVAMLGFTPVLSFKHSEYEKMSPRFDRLFISYAGLHDRSTIVHEMGHFLGLSHPWEMHHADQAIMGLHGEGAERNHMSYHPQVDHFTQEQLDRMQHFAITFRGYLVESIEYTADVVEQ